MPNNANISEMKGCPEQLGAGVARPLALHAINFESLASYLVPCVLPVVIPELWLRRNPELHQYGPFPDRWGKNTN